MRLGREDLGAALVSGALAASDVPGAYAGLLQPLRKAWRAERALLVRNDGHAGAVLVHADPAATAADGLDPNVLQAALEADVAVPVGERGAVLALGLRPRGEGPWCVALVRPGAAWTAAEERALADLRPYLELVLTSAVLRQQVATAKDQAAAAATEHERFLNVISHELRNPLAPILMWTTTLRRLRGDDPEVVRAAQAIAHAVGIERRLIEELLDLSRLERGAIELAKERTDLREVVQATLDQHRAAALEARLALEGELPPDPIVVHADPRRLAQVLEAPLGNALKFTPAGGRILLVLTRRGGHAEVSLTDTGPGIPAEVLPRLFVPFVAGPNARGGLGVGLAIARQLLALHHGTIEAVNPVEGGARFVITLPLARASA